MSDARNVRFVMRLRLAKAVVIVVLLICLAPMANLLANREAEGSQEGLSNAMVLLPAQNAGDPMAAFDAIEERLNEETGEVPMELRQEGVMPEDARDLRCSPTASVVGFCVDGDAQEVFESFDARMREQSWSSVPLGGVVGSTYMRKEGSIRWIVMTCTQVGDSTSVVMRYRIE